MQTAINRQEIIQFMRTLRIVVHDHRFFPIHFRVLLIFEQPEKKSKTQTE